MTVDQLTQFLNDTYGVHKRWPNTLQVDANTYSNVCQHIFEHQFQEEQLYWDIVETMEGEDKEPSNSDVKSLTINVGVANKGLMFKGVELLYHPQEFTSDLLDLIKLMPDTQTQQIVDYIKDLREIRRKHGRNN